MKPSWQDSPYWAAYLAKDADGHWSWFEYLPDRNQERWVTDGRVQHAGYVNDDWQDSMEARP